MANADEAPLVEFYRLIEQSRAPKRADRSGAGFLPSRAMRYCDALLSATGFGYWIFPPATLRLLWDGEQIFWSPADSVEWLTLSGTESGAVQYPGYEDIFDTTAPNYLRGYSPPFMTAMPELGGVQIWSGLLVKTRPGWSLNVRLPVNLPAIPGLTAWEGIVETDIWLGPLFNNFRLIKTDHPVTIKADAPFMQVQPVPQIAYRDELLSEMVVKGPEQIVDEDWNRLARVLLPNPDREARQGDYAVTVRKRRLCPVDDRTLLPGTNL